MEVILFAVLLSEMKKITRRNDENVMKTMESLSFPPSFLSAPELSELVTVLVPFSPLSCGGRRN